MCSFCTSRNLSIRNVILLKVLYHFCTFTLFSLTYYLACYYCLFRLARFMVQSLRIFCRGSRCTVEVGDRFTVCQLGLHLKGQYRSICLIDCTKFCDGHLDQLRFSLVDIVPFGMVMEVDVLKGCKDWLISIPLSTHSRPFLSSLIVVCQQSAFSLERLSYQR